MRYELKRISADGLEPVTLEEAKDWLRLEGDAEDATVGVLITAARQYAEAFCRRSLTIGEVWEMKLDSFPLMTTSQLEGFPGGVTSELLSANPEILSSWIDWSGIKLPMGPVQAISSITYQDAAGVQQTVDPATYGLDGDAQESRLYPLSGAAWPVARRGAGSVVITFVAGDNPEQMVKVAMRQILSHWYQNRDAVTQLNTQPQVVPMAAERLLWPYRKVRL
jgi:uncharacterized phiE125 gp8 family phage protein